MKRSTYFNISNVLYCAIATSFLVGCGTVVPSVTPFSSQPSEVPSSPQSPTNERIYGHFSLPREMNFHFEFNYPSSWVLSEDFRDPDSIIIVLYDPRFLSLPTPSQDDYHPTPNDFGQVSIWIVSKIPEQSADKLIELHRQGYGTDRIQMIENYKTSVLGYDASVFEDQIQFSELYTSLMFEKNTFFSIQNKMYQITLSVAEKDRGGEFEKGYEYFFNSLEIVP